MQKRKSGSAHTPQPKAIAMLVKDHRKVQKMFRDFVKMKREDDSDRADLIKRACKELTLHTQLEEQVFYPFALENLSEPDLIDEASVEHASAKELISQLEAGIDEEGMRDARFTVLGEYVNHHIKEEEEELFPKLVKAKETKEAMQVLAEQMQERKLALARELGMGAEVEAQMQSASRSRTSASRSPAIRSRSRPRATQAATRSAHKRAR